MEISEHVTCTSYSKRWREGERDVEGERGRGGEGGELGTILL